MKLRHDSPLQRITADVTLGERVVLNAFINLYGCRLGDDVMVGTFVEIQREVVIGPRCRIQSHSFICSGVTMEADVFVGHGVIFINDRHPSVIATRTGTWQLERTTIKQGVSIGSGALIFGGVTIGERAIIGAGAVVLADVAADSIVAGVPARLVKSRQ